ncbi:MAG: TIM barrel protein [Chloroflexota bacterium]|nr:TIM barrel protein [Chloroflexota bacterium]
MPKLAANVTMLFTEYPFLERFDRAAASGFRGVEFLFPYDEDPAVLQDALQRNGLDLVLFNLPSGDWTAGDRGLAADPARKDEFERGVDRAVEYAAALRPPRINCLAGKTSDPDASRDNLVANVRIAADALRATGTTLLLEPVNTHDVPGFALPTTQSALDLLAAVERDNVGLQFDVYHAMRMNEDPFAFLKASGSTIDHIQIADVPGRHQPGTGEIDFEQLFSIIDQSGYEEWVSLEYIPEGPTEEGFGLLRSLGLLA